MRGRILAAAAALLAIGLHGARLDAQATASVCKDGTTSAASGKGTCSGHGGVDAAATAAAKKAAKKTETAKAAPAAEVTCTDGTTSKGGRGACSKHGGIKGAAVPAATAAPTPAAPAAKPAPKSSVANAPAAAKTETKASTKRGEDNDPTDAIAQCKDGMYSHAANHRGACSKHGGVAKFLKP
jgi:predicted  nucleic acid-binding Zn-ribbon protein